ncbi:hypothetical protein DYB30_012889, partial [Aphanomyces astaci]
ATDAIFETRRQLSKSKPTQGLDKADVVPQQSSEVNAIVANLKRKAAAGASNKPTKKSNRF